MNVLSVDPGLVATGWAVFEDATLIGAGIITPEKGREGPARSASIAQQLHWTSTVNVHRPDYLVIEIPQIYRQSRSKGDPDDLLRLAILVGEIEAVFTGVPKVEVRPRAWKGTLPKKKMPEYLVHKRNALALGPNGRYAASLRNVPRSLAHNLADAVGIGIWFLRSKGLVLP